MPSPRGYNPWHHELNGENGYNGSPNSSARAFNEEEAEEFDLPHPEVFDGAKAAKLDKIADIAASLAWVLRYCWTGPGQRTRQPKAAFRRFVAVSMTVRPDLFDDGEMSFAAMAKHLRLTKAALSYLSLDFSDKAGLHFRRNRRQSIREKFAKVQREAWGRRKAG